jgi:hypothetical protein
MSEVHPRSTNLKLDLSYQDWELLASVCRTVSRGMRARGMWPNATRQTERLTLLVEDILAAQRQEGHV